jgi:hypothetical protein
MVILQELAAVVMLPHICGNGDFTRTGADSVVELYNS